MPPGKMTHEKIPPRKNASLLGKLSPWQITPRKIRPHYGGCHNTQILLFILPLKKIVDKLVNYALPPRAKAPLKFTSEVRMPLAKCPRGSYLRQRIIPTE